MLILIAPNTFKESLSAPEAAAAMERGVISALPGATVKKIPLADGGDGTLDTLMSQLPGTVHTAPATDPSGRTITGRFAILMEGATAVIEIAEVSGLKLIPPERRNPMNATSAGTGELIRRALDLGVKKIILALGGSATVDGGKDALTACGVRFLDAEGRELPRGGGGLGRLNAIDMASCHPRLRMCEWILLSDVHHPLCGPGGAAQIFGPQKGASAGDIEILDSGLHRLAVVIRETTGLDVEAAPGGGAAGGMAAGFYGLLKARIVPGAHYVMRLVSLRKELEGCSFLITGEGIFDGTSLNGKVTGEVLDVARARGIPTGLICGRCNLSSSTPSATLVEELKQHAPSIPDSMRRAALLIEEAAARLAARFKNRNPAGR